MRNYIKYLLVLSFVLLFSCQKHEYGPEEIFSDGGIISFSTKVQTKAPIITEMNGKHFGVYGYNFSYLTNWNTYKTDATPNVFYNLDVNCGADGVCSYSVDTETDINGYEEWVLNKRYSFFAYYPYTTATSPIALSGLSDKDIPYINYTLPITNGGSTDPDALLDIMTAKVTDYSATQGTTVRFIFNHRLFCIDLYGQNFNASEVTLSDLSIKVSGIHYNKTKIYMDNSVASEPVKTDESIATYSATFPIFTSKSIVAKSDLVSLSEDKNIVLIPQNSSLENATGLTVEIKFKQGTNTEYITRTATYNVDFQEGKKYTLTLNFIGNDVILVAANAAPWEKKDVTHTFD